MAEKAKPKVRVLIGIGTCDKFEYCEEHLLKSIFAQTYKDFDVLLVDNSSDRIYEMKLKANWPEVNIVHLIRPKFFRDAVGQARQFIMKYALSHGYEYLFFIDADHILEKDSLKKLISHDVDFISAQIGYLHKDWSTNFLPEPNPKKTAKIPGLPALRAITYEEMKEPPFFLEITACGLACVLIKTKVMLGMNFFVSHGSGPFLEDLVFCADLRKKGIKLHLDKTVKPFHLHVIMPERAFRKI